MRIPVIVALALALANAASAETELRCGWLDNPTPANWWLVDADGEWTISIQGQGEFSNFFDVAPTGPYEREGLHPSYGWSCACIEGVFDPETRRLTQTLAVRNLPLSQCREDPALPDRAPVTPED